MPSLDRDGLAIAYTVHGTGADRPPLLLTHGFAASGTMWDANVPALAADRRLITWDMRGHGSSDAPDDPSAYTHEACIGDMVALLDAVDTERAVLCGMSLGGFLSLRFRLAHPERVLGLALVDTGPGFRDGAARERWNDWARQLAGELQQRGTDALPRGREQAQAHHVHGALGIAHAARGMLVQNDAAVFEALDQISIPTLIVVGEEDTRFIAAADAMERRIPGARKIVLAGAGHASNMDAPEEFNGALGEFLDEL